MDVNKLSVLHLNRNWQALGVKSIKNAFVSITGGDKDNVPATPLNISYPILENGEFDFGGEAQIEPVSWVEWQSLPIREYDAVINTSKAKIRVPSVIVSNNFAKLPKRKRALTARTLFEIQKGICGYSGKKLPFSAGNKEHKIPKSEGGKDTWENLMWVSKEINSKRGNKPLSELGLTPLFNHSEPKLVPAPCMIKKIEHIDWLLFIKLN